MARQTVDLWVTDRDGVYVDATFGAGGHARATLALLGSRGRVIGCDRDSDILTRVRGSFQEFISSGKLTLHVAAFSGLRAVLAAEGVVAVNGILADLGVSSHQIDTPGRGFSFQSDGPLDMRMSPSQNLTAEIIVNTYPEQEIARILYEYGEERFSRRIARVICARRARAPFSSTLDLAGAIEKCVHRRGKIHPATRSFQGLRIAVNDELGELTALLESAPGLLVPGGRIAVISFHSLEDRRVKHFFREKHQQGDLRVLTKKPITGDAGEIGDNPRARSAKLRVAERSEKS